MAATPIRLFVNDEERDAVFAFSTQLAAKLGRGVEVHGLDGCASQANGVNHYGVWYQLRDSIDQDLSKSLVTIHHLVSWNETMEKLAASHIHFVTMSLEWFNYLRSRVSKSRVSIVPHGVDPEIWKPIEDSGDAKSLRPQRSIINIGVVGRTYPDGRKGERLLSKILRRLSPDRFQLTIVGVGWEKEIEKVRDLGFAVEHYVGLPCDQLVNVVSQFDVFLCTSEIEGGPLTLLECIAMGITPVSTPVGLARDLLVGSGLGYVYPKGSARIAARYLRHLSDRLLPWPDRSRLIAAATKISWEQSALGYEKIYDAIASNKPIPIDPLGYRQAITRRTGRLALSERLALWVRPEPTNAWHQPLIWRGLFKLNRMVDGIRRSAK